MKTALTSPEPEPEKRPTPLTMEQMIAKYRAEHSEALTNVATAVAKASAKAA